MVGRVADADVEVGEVGLDHVAEDDVEAFALRCALDTFGDFGGHARVEFDGDAFFGLFEDLDRQVAGAGTDFEDYVGLFKVSFVDDRSSHAGVLEDVLAYVCVHLEDGVRGRGGRGFCVG